MQPKKKSFVYNDDDNDNSDKSSCSMNQADHGTGALYIIMDAIKTLKADKEAEEKGWQFILPFLIRCFSMCFLNGSVSQPFLIGGTLT